ncbi:MAG: thrombospondin type 3 repeat-containing protein, partial [Deltaproteobacteria bacterium]|nr:thrombospondin type 3 repeat-containing protein [Deltaproteobacteria bacterium]
MPAVMQSGYEKGKFTDIAGGVNVGISDLPSFTPGDVRVIPKIRVLQLAGGAFSAALVGTVVIPVNKQPYAGERNIVYAPSLAMSFKTAFLRFGLNGGYRYRDPGLRIEPVPGTVLLIVDDEIFAKAAVAFDLNMGAGTPLEIIGEAYGHTPAKNPLALDDKGIQRDRQLSRTAVEGVLGVRMILAERFILTAGGGGGLAPYGYGQAVPRVFAGLSYYTGQFGLADEDLDGVPDDVDKCPGKKEDRDGYEDYDGCPDIDNDSDAVLDEDDQCPNEPEDKDGLGDDDGCPETDFDGDGIPDEKDKCPSDAEDKDGHKDDDGCPDLDNDGDGIADTVYKCPNEPEDIDN